MEPGHPHPSLLVSILLAAFIIWRFYARIRRMVVRQKLSKVRPWITVCVFPIVLVLFAVLSISHGVDLASLFGGAVVGIGWACTERASPGLRILPKACTTRPTLIWESHCQRC